MSAAGTVAERVARIEAACASCMGYAMRGVASWEQDKLIDWRDRKSLPRWEMVQLEAIEEQVFGVAR